MFADGHDRKVADDFEGKRGDCRSIRGGVLVGYKGGSFMFSLVI